MACRESDRLEKSTCHGEILTAGEYAMALSKGAVLHNKWWIAEPIKAGGMGAVYKAFDMNFQQRVVAVKEMLQEFTSDDTVELVKRKFREEANILARMRHQGIPQIIDYFIDKDIYYIVMEYVEGDNLDKVLQDYLTLTGKPIPESLMVECAIQICDVLEYLHSEAETLPAPHGNYHPQSQRIGKKAHAQAGICGISSG